MCLSYVYQGKKKKEALAKLKDVITVWKVLVIPDEEHPNWKTDIYCYPVHAGVVKFRQNIINSDGFGSLEPKYKGGGHLFLTKAGAVDWHDGDKYCKIVQCKVEKKDINNIGERDGFPIVVVKKATFPKYLGRKSHVY